MSKYKININKKEPSEEEINEFKDFNKIVKTYENVHKPTYVLRNIWKDRKLLRMIILLLIILFTVYFTHSAYQKNKKHKPDTPEIKKKELSKPHS